MTLFMLLLGPGSPIAVFAIFIASLSLVFVQKRYSWHVLHRQQQSSLTSAESVSSSSRSSSGNAQVHSAVAHLLVQAVVKIENG
jgi:hypothetical protein